MKKRIIRESLLASTIIGGAALSFMAATPAFAQSVEEEVSEVSSIVVTGSRIRQPGYEASSPITSLSSESIAMSQPVAVEELVKDLPAAVPAVGSATNNGSGGGATINLRGLGTNRTLVLINGRRVVPFNLQGVVDTNTIPLALVERVDTVTGGASAVYGADAVAGVVNFILKKQVDGTTIDMRMGTTSEGGGESFDMSIASGFDAGRFSAVYSLELQSQTPLWAYERSQQDSTLDAPTESARAARRAYLRTDYNDDYLDPGQATCDALAGQNNGSTQYAERARYGFYCGSDRSIGYGTILSKRRGANGYASLRYAFDNGAEWFADVQMGYHDLALMRDVTQWGRMAADGNEDGYFYNQATDQVEFWQRQFSPEEMGGLNNGMVRSTQKTFSVTTGFKGALGADWEYEASLSHSQYQSSIRWPQIIAAKANALFLGEQLGEYTDDDDNVFPVFNADPARLYRPLSRSEYDSIAARTTYTPKSRTDTAALTLTNGELFELPGGKAGFAATAEFGNQSYALNPDPLATQYYYYSWKDSAGHGSRNRWATAAELRLPLHDTFNVSVAGRFDQYRYSGNTIGKATWSGGLEWRPIDTLLVRGSYGTAFRAPDLHYVYAGPGNDETSANDYYTCAVDGGDDCSDYEENLIRTREGNRKLDPETSTSWSAGFVWSPAVGLDLSVDWFDIDMRDQVQDMDVSTILRDEAACRLGGADAASPTCVDAISRVTRTSDGRLYGVHVSPINIARETTRGIDVGLRYRLSTGIGDFILSGNHTWVKTHDFQQFEGDVVEDQFAINSGFDIPRTKTSASVTWENAAWSATLYGSRLGKLPTYDSYDQSFDPDSGDSPWIGATYRYNVSLQYRFDDHSRLSLSVVNIANKLPPKDVTYTPYPYYDVSWFDTVGRTINLQYTHKFGGTAL